MIPLQRVPPRDPSPTRELPAPPARERWWVLRVLHACTLALAVGFGLLIACGLLLFFTGGVLLIILALAGLVPVPVGCAVVIAIVIGILAAEGSDAP